MEGSPHSARSLAWSVFLLCVIVLVSYFMTASGTLFGSDGPRRFLVTKNLVENGRVDIQTSDRSPIGIDGKQYTQYAIGHSLLMAPFYIIGEQIASFDPQRRNEIVEFSVSMTNLLVTVVLVGWLAVFSRELGFGLKTSLLLGLLYAFGTMAWQQAKDSFEHPQVALYFTILFYYLYQFSRKQQITCLLLAGLTLGAAVMTRYTAVLAFVSVVVFLGVLAWQSASPDRLQKVLLWLAIIGLTTLPFLAFDLWFNYIRFGNPFETGQQQLFGSLLAPETFLTGLWGLTFQWEHGLFLFNPLLLLWFAGIPGFFRRHAGLAISFLVITGLHLAFYASTKEILWTGGWAWGPRFMGDVLPLMVLMCAPVVENLQQELRANSFAKYAALVLISLSVMVQVESVLVNYNRGFAKKAIGISGYSYDSHGFKDSLLYMQAENILEIAQNLLRGQGPSKGEGAPGARVSQTGSSLDDMLTFGTFQIWWVYALHLGIAAKWIVWYLAGSATVLVLASVALWRRMKSDASHRSATYPIARCMPS